MARPDRTPHGRGGRLRLMAGFSIVMGGIAFLLAAQSRPVGREEVDHRAEAPPSPQALHDGFEPQDANARSIGTVMAVGAAAIAASIAGLFLLLGVFHARDARTPPLTAQQGAQIAPPGPPLQSSPLYDIASLRNRENGLLQGYRWLSPDHATAQIPIERAMALTVGKPLDPAP